MRLGIAAITAGAVSWIGAVNLPLLLGALSEAYGFTPQQLGVFATLAIAGVATGSIATTFLQYRLRRRVITAIGALLVVVANAAATQFEDFQTLALLRFLGECGSGALMAIAVKTISEFGNPSRFFGLMTSLLMVMSLILFFGVAGVIEQYGSDIVYLSHAAFGLPVLAMIVWLNEPDLSDEIPGLRQARPGRSLLAAALGLFAMYASRRCRLAVHGAHCSGIHSGRRDDREDHRRFDDPVYRWRHRGWLAAHPQRPSASRHHWRGRAGKRHGLFPDAEHPRSTYWRRPCSTSAITFCSRT